ncbi:hypothetical protein JCM11251_002711 [Rhodosporidiobolus azoricus]
MSIPSASSASAAHSSISGTEYLSSLASFIRKHESSLANYYAPRSRSKTPPPPSWATVLTLGIVPTAEGSSSPAPPPPPPPRRDPLVLKFDPHHLYYLLLKFDELAIPGVGDLDVKVDGGTSRPMSVDYSSLNHGAGEGGGPGSLLGGMFGLGNANGRKNGADDAMSIRSGMSSFSFGSGWWGLGGQQNNPADEASDVRYIYSSCTKLPALKLSPFRLSAAPPPGSKDSTPALVRAVDGFEDCPPPSTCVPLLAFKNLSSLALEDLDPRGFYGWDVLSVQLRSLEVNRGGIEDIGELICDAPVEDEVRRRATERRDRAVGSERRKRAEGSTGSLATSIVETQTESDATVLPKSPTTASYPTPSKLAWSSLRHLSLADNDLTFIPSPPLAFLPTLTSLDLSSNLLISIPPGLARLTSLRSLNLSNNMIDSLLGVAKALGAIEVLNLSGNRLENLSGLNRLAALERLDVRDNHLNEALEVSRVARLPHLREVWIRGNPFARKKEEGGEENWRVKCFGYFAKEEACGHRNFAVGEMRIDGACMSGSERRAVEAEQARRGTPMGKHRRASVGAVERVAESRNGKAKVVGRRVVTAPHRTHHHDGEGGHTHRAASPPPPLPTASTSAAADSTPRAASPTPITTKSPAKAKRRRPRRVVDLDAAPGSAVAHPAAPPSSSSAGRYSDSEPTSSGAETSRARVVGRAEHPSTVAEEPATTTTDDGGLSSSPAVAAGTEHARHASSPHTSRIAGVSTLSSASPSKQNKRRDRVSVSTYEPATNSAETFGGGVESGADAYRRRIEKLREEVGDHYLSVLGEREAMEELVKRKKGAKEDVVQGRKEAEVEEVVKPVAVKPAEAEGAPAIEVQEGRKDAEGTGGSGEAQPEEVPEEAQEQEAAAIAPAMKEGVKVVKKKKKGKGKKK